MDPQVYILETPPGRIGVQCMRGNECEGTVHFAKIAAASDLQYVSMSEQ